MSISSFWIDHPETSIGRAYHEAGELLDRFCGSPSNELCAAALAGWTGVDLCERIAMALLEAKGYDTDLIDLAIHDYRCEETGGWALGDLLAELERTRGQIP